MFLNLGIFTIEGVKN